MKDYLIEGTLTTTVVLLQQYNKIIRPLSSLFGPPLPQSLQKKNRARAVRPVWTSLPTVPPHPLHPQRHPCLYPGRGLQQIHQQKSTRSPTGSLFPCRGRVPPQNIQNLWRTNWPAMPEWKPIRARPPLKLPALIQASKMGRAHPLRWEIR